MQLLVKLTYFKRTGKLYSAGSYYTQCEHAFEVYREVAALRSIGSLPELLQRNTHTHFVVLVEIPGLGGVPQLIGADDAHEILVALLKLGPRHDRQLSEPTDEDTKRWNDWDSEYAALHERATRAGVIE